MRRLVLFLIPILLASVPAHASRIAFVGAANSAQPNQPGTEYTSVTAYGAGVLLEMRMVPAFGLELGALYLPRKFSYATTTPSTANFTVTAAAWEFPALFRLHLGRSFSLGFGGYYAKAKGNLGIESESNGAKGNNSATYASQNASDSDYGIATSLAMTFRLAPLMHLLFDARYLIGVKNTSLSGSGDRKFNDMELLAGLQFGF